MAEVGCNPNSAECEISESHVDIDCDVKQEPPSPPSSHEEYAPCPAELQSSMADDDSNMAADFNMADAESNMADVDINEDNLAAILGPSTSANLANANTNALIESQLSLATGALDAVLDPEELAAIRAEIMKGVADLQDEMEAASKPKPTIQTCPYCSRTYKSALYYRRHLNTHKSKGPVTTHECNECLEVFDSLDRLRRHKGRVHGYLPVKCKHCPKTFSTRCDAVKHQAMHTTERQYKCTHYDQGFKRISNMRKHIARVHLGMKYVCKICPDKKFATPCALSGHMRVEHTGEKPYNCRYCDLSFSRLFCRSTHELIHTGQKPYECDMCSMRFRSSGDRVKHRKRHLGIKDIQCPKCPRKFPVANDMKKHLNDFHSNLKPFQCKMCNKWFKREIHLTIHQERVHLQLKKSKCNLCGKRLASPSALVLHIRYHNNEKPYPCTQCEARFFQKKDLNYHMDKHKFEVTGVKTHGCDICNKLFTTRRQMLNHRPVHKPDRPHECHICEKSFKLRNHLKAHLKTHGNEKPFGCDICSSRFYTKTNLETHKRIHSGAKPFTCEYCNKGFNQKCNKETHVKRIHTKVKPFSCEHCDKSFVDMCNLRLHVNRMHTTDRHKCPKCPRTFRQAGKLKLHMMKHDGNHPNRKIDKPFVCELCETRFKSQFGLNLHTDRIHKNKEGKAPYPSNGDVSRYESDTETEDPEAKMNETTTSIESELTNVVRTSRRQSRAASVQITSSENGVTSPEVGLGVTKLEPLSDSEDKNCDLTPEGSTIGKGIPRSTRSEYMNYSNTRARTPLGIEKTLQCEFCPMKFALLAHLNRHKSCKHPTEMRSKPRSAKAKSK